MLLLFPETAPGIVPERRAQETKAFIYGHSADLALAGFELVVWKCSSYTDYERAIYDLWARAKAAGGGFMIVEQDVVPPSVTYLEEMARCPENMCVAPVEDHSAPFWAKYRYDGSPWECSVGTPGCRPGPSLSSWVDRFYPHRGSRPTHPEDDYANGFGLGITKFSAKLCRKTLALSPGYSGLDGRIAGFLAMSGAWRWCHIHWNENRTLVKHAHTFCNGDPIS